jgi:two-component system sensor histidine kinase DegS
MEKARNLKENKRLDEIIDSTIISIQQSSTEIKEISHFAKKEYQELEDEFLKLRIEASELIDRVEKLDREYRISKSKLIIVNKNYDNYSEEEMKRIYDKTDHLRVQLVLEREREMNIVKRRNELELHLKSVRNIVDKADKVSNDFELVHNMLHGNLKDLTEHIGQFKSERLLGYRIIHAQEEERQRIARELHDGPAQSLSNISFKAEICLKLVDKDIAKAKLELQTLKGRIHETIEETRELIYNLRPMSIDDLGLVPTLERYIDQVESVNDFSIQLNIEYQDGLKIENIPKINSLTLFRIVQESLNNIQKYADADEIIINLILNNQYTEISIDDNGCGFDVAQIKTDSLAHTGLGVSIMRERVNLLAGQFDLSSKLGQGTRVFARLPINRERS